MLMTSSSSSIFSPINLNISAAYSWRACSPFFIFCLLIMLRYMLRTCCVATLIFFRRMVVRPSSLCMNKTMAHKNRPCCSFEGGCTKHARNGGVCVLHGAKVILCSYKGGSTNQARKGGVCVSHGAKVILCNVEGGCTIFVHFGI